MTADSQGFVHAPSLEHARAAAVLRGRLDARPAGDLAINLWSDRVRHARWLLAQMSAGQSLAALLGYRIERLLVDSGLGSHVDDLRTRFPLAESAEGDVARPRLDGLAAHEAWAAAPSADVLLRSLQRLRTPSTRLPIFCSETVHRARERQSQRRRDTCWMRLRSRHCCAKGYRTSRSPVPASFVTYQLILSLEAAPPAPVWPAQLSARALANPLLEARVGAPAAAVRTAGDVCDSRHPTAPTDRPR